MSIETTLSPELRAALKVLVDVESVGDWVYEVRERALADDSFTGNTWDHPRVKAFSDAVTTITTALREAEQA